MAGDYAGAVASARTARKLAIIAIICGVILLCVSAATTFFLVNAEERQIREHVLDRRFSINHEAKIAVIQGCKFVFT